MESCDFELLVRLLDDDLDLDSKLEVLSHLDQCTTCRDAVYQISRDRDGGFFIYRPYREPAASRRRAATTV
jgi:anti-sigma factor RsiW